MGDVAAPAIPVRDRRGSVTYRLGSYQAERSRVIIASHDLDDLGQPSERWDGADPATLQRVLFHLPQEYARHLGQLDVVVELAIGLSGE